MSGEEANEESEGVALPGTFALSCAASSPEELCATMSLGGAASLNADDDGNMFYAMAVWGKSTAEEEPELPEGGGYFFSGGLDRGEGSWETMSCMCDGANCSAGPSGTAKCAEDFDAMAYWTETATSDCLGDASCMKGAMATMAESCPGAADGAWKYGGAGENADGTGYIWWARAADMSNDNVGAIEEGTKMSIHFYGGMGTGDFGGDDMEVAAAWFTTPVAIEAIMGASTLQLASAALLGYLCM